MNAVTLLCDATIIAVRNIAQQRNINLDVDKVSMAIKNAINSNLDRVMAEWKEATEANIGEAWLKVMINTQAYELALEALEGMQ